MVVSPPPQFHRGRWPRRSLLGIPAGSPDTISFYSYSILYIKQQTAYFMSSLSVIRVGPSYRINYAICYICMLHATCYMLHATCYMLHAICYMLYGNVGKHCADKESHAWTQQTITDANINIPHTHTSIRIKFKVTPWPPSHQFAVHWVSNDHYLCLNIFV